MRLECDGQTLDIQSGETVLECMERHGIAVPSSCRSGVCQSCLVRGVGGDIPANSQVGLRPAQKKKGYFMACMCRPAVDLEVSRESNEFTFESSVVRAEPLAPNVYGVWLTLPQELIFEAGQFIQVVRPEDNTTRPYSLAAPAELGMLELHVALAPSGRMSRWLPFAVGERIFVRGPFGECTYDNCDPDAPLLLAGTGTGLAPLLGVVREALRRGHTAPICVYHGARQASGLYGRTVLDQLAEEHENLRVTYSALEVDERARCLGVTTKRIDDAVLDDFALHRDSHALLCGNPDFVKGLKKQLYLSGLALDRIHADPFVSAPVVH